MVEFKEKVSKFKNSIRGDPNIAYAKSHLKYGVHALPRATLEYVVDKVPIAQWLPRYYWKWLLNDVVAGLTVGVLLVTIPC